MTRKKHFPLRQGEGITLAKGYAVLERVYVVMNDDGILYGTADVNRSAAWDSAILTMTGSIYGSKDRAVKKRDLKSKGYRCEQIAVVRP